jgi:MFS family permease
LATALTGLVTSFAMIFMLRLVLGFGESVAYPCNAKFLAQRVPSGQRGRANGLIAVGQSLGPTCGTLVGGLVMAHFGWRPAFMRCGIYPDRPLVCRIYPAEINPFVALKRENKACPPEAWAQDQPLFQRGEVLMDDVTSRDIAMSRAADVLDADLKSRLCLALNLASTALVHEAVSVYSPTAQTLLSALAFAIVADSCPKPAAQWRFVSDQQETLESLAKSGGITLHLRDAEAASFQYLGFKREAIFGLNTDRDSLLRNH